jgi:hypothetical protein
MKNEMSNYEAQVVNDIRELMAGWNKIEAAAKAQFPSANKEELYAICKGAMDYAFFGK